MRKATAAMIGIWALGIASASALVYALNRPLVPPPATHDSAIATAAPARADAPVAFGSASADVPPAKPVTMPPLTVTSHDARRPSTQAALRTLPRRWRDLSEMRCTDWKPLEMGSTEQGVRYCE